MSKDHAHVYLTQCEEDMAAARNALDEAASLLKKVEGALSRAESNRDAAQWQVEHSWEER